MSDIQTEKTYDSVFWTGVVRLTPYLIPLVNEVFGTHYSSQTQIRLLPMKQVTKMPDQSLEERETDQIAELRDGENGLPAYYHFEVETWAGSSIAIRIAEYAAGAAFSSIQPIEDGAKMTIPHSAVIVLRKSSKEDFYLTIEYPHGAVRYQVPVIRMADYTLEELLEKKLYLLLPFFGFLYVNTEEELNTETILKRFREDFDRICREFDDESGKKLLEKDEAYYLLELIQRVLDKLFADNNEITEEVDKTMGGKLIEFELDRKMKESREEGTSLTVDAVKAFRDGKTEADLRRNGFDECAIKAAREIVALYS